MPELTPALLLKAYAAGIFPMADSADDPDLYWVDPERRGVLPLDGFHLPHRLRRVLRNDSFAVTIDRDFPGVIAGCAAPSSGRPETWISGQIRALYTELHRQGHAHSVEARIGDELVGGLYGVALGGAFFGESMFSSATDASKVALAHLVVLLRTGGFTLLDVQFVTAHLQRFGATEIPRVQYRAMLAAALRVPAHFPGVALGGAVVAALLQSSTLTS